MKIMFCAFDIKLTILDTIRNGKLKCHLSSVLFIGGDSEEGSRPGGSSVWDASQ